LQFLFLIFGNDLNNLSILTKAVFFDLIFKFGFDQCDAMILDNFWIEIKLSYKIEIDKLIYKTEFNHSCHIFVLFFKFNKLIHNYPKRIYIFSILIVKCLAKNTIVWQILITGFCRLLFYFRKVTKDAILHINETDILLVLNLIFLNFIIRKLRVSRFFRKPILLLFDFLRISSANEYLTVKKIIFSFIYKSSAKRIRMEKILVNRFLDYISFNHTNFLVVSINNIKVLFEELFLLESI